MRTHPPWQHVGCIVGQLHLFCYITNSTPVRLQSVTLQVHVLSVNDVTPWLSNLTISTFAVSKDCCNSSVQMYLASLGSNFRKGCMSSVLENEKATCSKSPNQDLIPVRSNGRGKFVMADKVLSVGFIPSFLSQNPTYSNSCWPHLNFFGFWITPCDPWEQEEGCVVEQLSQHLSPS